MFGSSLPAFEGSFPIYVIYVCLRIVVSTHIVGSRYLQFGLVVSMNKSYWKIGPFVWNF